MRLPNFTAEFSLYKSREPYQLSQTITQSQESIYPAQFGGMPIPGGPGVPDGPILRPPRCFPLCWLYCPGFPLPCRFFCRYVCI